MSKVASASPDPDKDTLTLQRQVDTHKSDAHVSQLLAIGNHSMQLLVLPGNFNERVDANPDAVKTALETFQLAHLQLRNMIDETRRWSLDPTASEKEASRLVESTLDLYNEKTANAKIYNRPSVFLRPKIAQLEMGWCVWVGGDLPRKSDMHGLGNSPAEAMNAFDAVYHTVRKISEAPQTLVVPPAPAPVPKRRAVRGPRTSKSSA